MRLGTRFAESKKNASAKNVEKVIPKNCCSTTALDKNTSFGYMKDYGTGSQRNRSWLKSKSVTCFVSVVIEGGITRIVRQDN